MKMEWRHWKRMIFILLACAGVLLCPPQVKSRAAAAPYTCTVVFISNDGEFVPTQTLKQGTSLSNLPTPKREGYIFEGWYTNESLTMRIGTSYYMPISNQDTVLVLYAKWTKIAVRTITAVYADKTATVNTELDRTKLTVQAAYSNGTVAEVTDYTLPNTKVNSIGVNSFTVTYEGSMVNFYVVGIAEQYYTVTFLSNGGSSVDTITGVKAGDTIILPQEPTRSGYTFKGWYQDSSYKLPFTTQTQITYNMLAFAQWEKDVIITEEITYELNKTAMNIKIDATDNLFVISYSPDTENYVQYLSNDETVATVDEDGLVTAVGYGTATIRVIAPDGSILKCKVAVSPRKPVKKLQTNVANKRLKTGETYTIKTTVSPSTATIKKVKYTSTNKKIATVTAAGKVTAKKPGVCYIKVETTDGSNVSQRVKIRVL